jgi:hypothetical protein
MDEIQTVTVHKVFVNTKNKNDEPYKDKNGSPFSIANLIYDGTKQASMFLGKWADKEEAEIRKWKEGDRVLVKITQDGNFTNFSIPNRKDLEIAGIWKAIEVLQKDVASLKGEEPKEKSEDDFDLDDLIDNA